MEKHFNYTYIPAERPTPMLGYETSANENLFAKKEDVKFEFGKFNPNYQHIWNIGAYLIYDLDKKEVIAYQFSELSYLIWLLRIINQPLMIQFSETITREHSKLFTNNSDQEFKLD